MDKEKMKEFKDIYAAIDRLFEAGYINRDDQAALNNRLLYNIIARFALLIEEKEVLSGKQR